MQPWQGGGFAVCGNKDCHTSTVNEELNIKNCGTTTKVWSRSDVECPKLRACPRCLAVNHIFYSKSRIYFYFDSLITKLFFL